MIENDRSLCHEESSDTPDHNYFHVLFVAGSLFCLSEPAAPHLHKTAAVVEGEESIVAPGYTLSSILFAAGSFGACRFSMQAHGSMVLRRRMTR
ncbi:MAG TPA: hypothetical protein PK843_13390 [bacterium]|nr:hypothetical protein [bacterium]